MTLGLHKFRSCKSRPFQIIKLNQKEKLTAQLIMFDCIPDKKNRKKRKDDDIPFLDSSENLSDLSFKRTEDAKRRREEKRNEKLKRREERHERRIENRRDLYIEKDDVKELNDIEYILSPMEKDTGSGSFLSDEVFDREKMEWTTRRKEEKNREIQKNADEEKQKGLFEEFDPEKANQYQNIIQQAKHSGSNRDILINMLHEHLMKFEEQYKKTIDESQDLRFKYLTVMQELSTLKKILEKVIYRIARVYTYTYICMCT